MSEPTRWPYLSGAHGMVAGDVQVHMRARLCCTVVRGAAATALMLVYVNKLVTFARLVISAPRPFETRTPHCFCKQASVAQPLPTLFPMGDGASSVDNTRSFWGAHARHLLFLRRPSSSRA